MGMLGVDICEWIIWAIFKCTKLHYTFCNVSTPRGLQNLYIYKETVLCLFCKACLQSCIAWRRLLGVETLQKYEVLCIQRLIGIFGHKYLCLTSKPNVWYHPSFSLRPLPTIITLAQTSSRLLCDTAGSPGASMLSPRYCTFWLVQTWRFGTKMESVLAQSCSPKLTFNVSAIHQKCD